MSVSSGLEYNLGPSLVLPTDAETPMGVIPGGENVCVVLESSNGSILRALPWSWEAWLSTEEEPILGPPPPPPAEYLVPEAPTQQQKYTPHSGPDINEPPEDFLFTSDNPPSHQMFNILQRLGKG